ncbi:MAG TPA: hypothetical protein VNF29_09165 [Candidatus Binataceae bacterium]|nr:hypothetical protein [Candidatus Binataceae bacterium]
MTLVFYAFARELAPFKRRLKSRRALDDPYLRGFRAQLGATEIVAVATGIGMERAQAAARRALDLYPDVDLVLGTGVAGALSSGLVAGDLVVADRILTDRGDGAAGAAEQVAAIDPATLSELGRYLRTAGVAYSTGAILTTHHVLTTGSDKRAAKERTGAIAVDMETAAIAAETHARGLRFAAIRAVMDGVDEEVVGARMADQNGDVRPLQATGFLIRNPGVVIRLPRMMLNLGRAARSLAIALEAIVTRGEPAPAQAPRR